MDVEDRHYFHQTGKDVSRTNHSGHLYTHNYVQKDSEVYYRPQKRLKGSRTSTLEETLGRSATQIDMSNEDINTGAIRPDVQPREQPKPLFSHYGEPSHKTDVLQDHRLDQEHIPSHNQQCKRMLSPNEANCNDDKKLHGDRKKKMVDDKR